MITLVCGPPCAGKSTLVLAHQQTPDLVVDHDDLAVAAGSPVTHTHRQVYRDAAELRAQQLIRHIARRAHAGDAWVIRTHPRLADRQRLADQLNADRVVVLNPGRDVVEQRAMLRTRPAHTLSIIAWWYREYDGLGDGELTTLTGTGR